MLCVYIRTGFTVLFFPVLTAITLKLSLSISIYSTIEIT